MDQSTIVPLIAQFGFPIFVAVWLMLRTDKFIQENTRVTMELTVLLRALAGREDHGGGQRPTQ